MAGKNIKFEMHDIIAKILIDRAFMSAAKFKTMMENKTFPSVCQCNKAPLIHGNSAKHVDRVRVRKNKNGGVYFSGLMTCGSVWTCPICAPKIAEQRCKEIAYAFEKWREMGQTWDKKNKRWLDVGETHNQLMVTLTIPHVYNQSLKDIRDTFMLARRLLKQQKVLRKKPNLKVFSQLKEEYGIKGDISAIEITYGVNGWHVHCHDILFINRQLTDDQLKELQKRLVSAWVYACKRAKVKMTKKQEKAMFEHEYLNEKTGKKEIFSSVKVDRAFSAEEYVSKFGYTRTGWGPEVEVSKNHLKQARGEKGLSPWDFVAIIQDNPDDRKTYLKYGRLFNEYYQAFKGKRQIFWSKGFKSELDISDYILSDVEAAKQESESDETLGYIDGKTWWFIVKNNLRGPFIKMAEKIPFNKAVKLIWGLDPGG